MVGTSSSSSSSCASISSFDDVSVKTGSAVKFLCSYGGKILPRYPDGKLRYVGGETRVLAVDRSIPYSELQLKLGELSGWGEAVSLRCQLPTEDLDALVTVTSDEDLANLMEEYDLAAARDRQPQMKIRAFLHPARPHKPSSPPPPPTPVAASKGKAPARPDRCVHQIAAVHGRLAGPDLRFQGHHHHHHHHHHHQASTRPQQYLVHHGNYWQ